MSRASCPPKCLLSQTSFCLRRCPLGCCLFPSSFSWFSLSHSHLVFMGHQNHYCCTERKVILPLSVTKKKKQNISLTFLKKQNNDLTNFRLLTHSVSVNQKCDTNCLPNTRRLLKYLCLDMTGQCEVHLWFKQALNVLSWWDFFIFFEQVCGVN